MSPPWDPAVVVMSVPDPLCEAGSCRRLFRSPAPVLPSPSPGKAAHFPLSGSSRLVPVTHAPPLDTRPRGALQARGLFQPVPSRCRRGTSRSPPPAQRVRATRAPAGPPSRLPVCSSPDDLTGRAVENRPFPAHKKERALGEQSPRPEGRGRTRRCRGRLWRRRPAQIRARSPLLLAGQKITPLPPPRPANVPLSILPSIHQPVTPQRTFSGMNSGG